MMPPMHLAPVMNIPHHARGDSIQPVDAKTRQAKDPPRRLSTPRLSGSERRIKPRLSKPSLDPVIEGDQRPTREVQSPPPGDITKVTRKYSLPEFPRPRSDYFEETFAALSPEDQVRNESIVLAEVKTNVIVNDEYTFVSELSEHLALRYHRPVSSIVVTLHHGACILFGGSCDPAYIMTVEALACYAQTATNKRNNAMIQRHMEQALGVSAMRGFLRFVPVAEECSGWKGKTVASEIAEATEQAQPPVEHRDSIKAPRRRSSKAYRDIKGRAATIAGASTSQAISRSRSIEEARSSKYATQEEPEPSKEKSTMKRRRSFMQALFPRSSSVLRTKETT
ncbi:hypothetical protein BHE90_014131 [Fusarium euwallaceae]|uniref:L-dopachrome isomerase n=1 Tax=Fusarium euwallaceae TaxID=1147111 RepID=A0A430L6X8_9HYPO|nr:hypothetical protein BHE90_014131 [Fusarium euwallaceae]